MERRKRSWGGRRRGQELGRGGKLTMSGDWRTRKADRRRSLKRKKRRKKKLTNDCVPSRYDAVKDAIKHNPMRKQCGHNLPYQPAKCCSYRTTVNMF